MSTKTDTQTKKFFGTDGIRGEIGTKQIHPQDFFKLGWALGNMLCEQGQGDRKVCVGRDTRSSGHMLESAIVSGLTAAGVDVERLGVVPTPLVAQWTRTTDCDAGVMITASHNPATDNGVKFCNCAGEKIGDEQRNHISSLFSSTVVLTGQHKFGKTQDVSRQAADAYVEFIIKNCGEVIPELNKKKVVIDPGFGAASSLAKLIFDKIGFTVIMINNQDDGYNINQKSGSTDTYALAKAVIKQNADFGVAFDGDADRAVLVDAKGQLSDGDDMLLILAMSNPEVKKVVLTPMSNPGVVEKLKNNGKVVIPAKIGDQNIYHAMRQHDADLGAEPNGHIIIRGLNQSGDGILSALLALLVVCKSQKTLDQWRIEKFPQKLINLTYSTENEGLDLERNLQKRLSESSQITTMIRKSGTEPVVRVLLQGKPGQEAVVDEIEKQLMAL